MKLKSMGPVYTKDQSVCIHERVDDVGKSYNTSTFCKGVDILEKCCSNLRLCDDYNVKLGQTEHGQDGSPIYAFS